MWQLSVWYVDVDGKMCFVVIHCVFVALGSVEGGWCMVSVVFFPLLNIQEFCCVKAGENSVQRLFPVFFTHKFHGQVGSYILSSMVLIYGMAQ